MKFFFFELLFADKTLLANKTKYLEAAPSPPQMFCEKIFLIVSKSLQENNCHQDTFKVKFKNKYFTEKKTLSVFFCSFFATLENISRGVYRTMCSICDGTFYGNNSRLKVVNHFRKKISCRCITVF